MNTDRKRHLVEKSPLGQLRRRPAATSAHASTYQPLVVHFRFDGHRLLARRPPVVGSFAGVILHLHLEGERESLAWLASSIGVTPATSAMLKLIR